MTKSILIIEDELVLQDVYKLVLTHHGYDVHTAPNGLEGIVQIKRLKPDMVLLDLFMPKMDGKELLRTIDTSDYPNTKIIVYTNLSDKDTETEVLRLGAHKLVLKSDMTPRDLIHLTVETIGPAA